MELTLELAKQLAEKKWQAIVDHDGSDSHIEDWVPEIDGMRAECAMCEFMLNQEGLKCESCLYNHTVCGMAYANWVQNACSETAQSILNAIKLTNELNK